MLVNPNASIFRRVHLLRPSVSSRKSLKNFFTVSHGYGKLSLEISIFSSGPRAASTRTERSNIRFISAAEKTYSTDALSGGMSSITNSSSFLRLNAYRICSYALSL